MFGRIEINNSNRFFLACCMAPFIGGLISIWLGADTNWDLRNYHLYNPFALLNNKIAMDLAPAGMQTYFNPLLDIPYYWMTNHLPAVIVGFIMGFIQAGNFILIALIARQLLPNLGETDKFKLPLLFALFGCLTANFSSAFGSTMGDNFTAMFVLSGLLILVRAIRNAPSVRIVPFLLAGFLAGIAMGLKLTNAMYSLALCLSIFALPVSWFMQIKLATLFGVAALVGLLLTAGFWFYEMWSQFGNPMFPQFSVFFPNELTRNDIAVADTRWLPNNFFEALLWPIILSVNPLRVGELKHHQFIWAIFYVVAIMCVVSAIFFKRKTSSTASLTPAAKYVIVFVVISFVIWMKLFSIQRYLAAIEVLIPLIIFVLLSRIFVYEMARKYSKHLMIISALIVYLGGAKSWGHADWASDMFRAELPMLASPEKTTVILAGGHPLGWLVAQFPASVAFVQVEGSFPANRDSFSNQIDRTVNEREGEVFVIFPIELNSSRIERVNKANSILKFFGVMQSVNSCDHLAKLIPLLRVENKVRLDYGMSNKCFLTALDPVNPLEIDNFYHSQANQRLNLYGFELNQASCKRYNAFIAARLYQYEWCSVTRRK